jgi:serine/threonine protein kinase
LNEVIVLSNLTCNFVVELSAVFQDDNSLYLLMEYCAGGELFSHLRRNEKFPPDVAKFYALEVASALKSMHKWNLIYRDLKPENIMICKDGHLKLVDFGFAKKMTLDTPYSYTLCGTPEYLAPETIRGIGHDRAVDWWALGILLYEMLVGYPPFFADNPFALYQKILKGIVKFPTNVVGTTAQTAIKGFLHLDRTRRMSYNNKTGFSTVEKCAYFKGVDWESVENKLIVPVVLPTINAEGDTSNFDYYEEEAVEEVSNLNSAERALFHEFDVVLGRAVQL